MMRNHFEGGIVQSNTIQKKLKKNIKGFYNKSDQIHRKLQVRKIMILSNFNVTISLGMS